MAKRNKTKTPITPEGLATMGWKPYKDYDVPGDCMYCPGLPLRYYNSEKTVLYGMLSEQTELKYLEDVWVVMKAFRLMKGSPKPKTKSKA
jgi:hypothetical protein